MQLHELVNSLSGRVFVNISSRTQCVCVWVCLGTGEITEEELLTRLQQVKDEGQRSANGSGGGGASTSPSPSQSPSPSAGGGANANGTSVRRPEASGE